MEERAKLKKKSFMKNLLQEAFIKKKLLGLTLTCVRCSSYNAVLLTIDNGYFHPDQKS